MLKSDGDTFTGECQTGTGLRRFRLQLQGPERALLRARTSCSSSAGRPCPGELLSPVDVASHGTHTASTAAGNANVEAVVDGRSFGQTSGIAPAAKLSVYKVCWEDNDPNTGGCYRSASVDAIDQAIKDGVDVLNYSISGATDTTIDPVSHGVPERRRRRHLRRRLRRQLRPDRQHRQPRRPLAHHGGGQQLLPGAQGTVEFSDGTKFRGASIMNNEVKDAGVVLAANAAAAGERQPGPVRPRHPGPGEGRRQGRGLRPRRRRPRRQERRGQARRRRRHDPGEPEQFLAGHRQARRPHRPREPAGHRGHQGQGGRQPGHHGLPGQQGHHRTAAGGAAADCRLLLPRPAAGHRLGPAEAGRHRAGCCSPGRRVADRHRR